MRLIDADEPSENLQELVAVVKQSLESCAKAIETVTGAFKKSIDSICEYITKVYEAVLSGLIGKRVVHLAYHAKRFRTRKKNKRRITQAIRALLLS